ncbi:hypothetical protein C8Q76DRAFT_621605 [Earliella scabrosa]|nr:hypothetical protein C8Q76DRAFT_621605 [Earliella scabrosa]
MDDDNYDDLVPRSGRFLGSTGSLFRNQAAADIYLQYYWRTVGWLRRVRVVCVTWGLSVAVVERAFRAHPNNAPTNWQIDNPGLMTITVQDQGQQFTHLPYVPANLPNAASILAPGAYYNVNGQLHVAHPIPWHHGVALRSSRKNKLLHYHQHARRTKRTGGPPPILPENVGNHYTFREMRYSTQVQNCRKAYPH